MPLDRPLAVLLCAGASSRMGRCKALLPLDGRPLVAHHVQALATHCEVVVLTGADAAAVQHAVDVRCVHNPDWASTGPLDSLRVGLRAFPQAERVVVSPVDVPPVRDEALSRLLSATGSAVPVGPDGVAGHPVLLAGAELARVRREAVSGGLRVVLAGAERVAVPGAVGGDFDTPAAFAAFVARR